MSAPTVLPPDQEQLATVRFDRLLDAVYPHLNALHGVSRSRRFWAILLYRYLSKCLIVDRAGLPPREAPRTVLSDEAVLGPRVGDDTASESRARGGTRFRAVRNRLTWTSVTPAAFRERARLKGLQRTPVSGSRSVLHGFHHFHVIAGQVPQPACWLKPEALRGRLNDDVAKRAVLQEIATTVDWPLARLALDWIPRWFVEDFLARDERVQVVDPEQKAFHASFLSSVEGQFVIARYVEEGATLTMYQHAAMYGEVEHHVFHHVESIFADRFCTWGWALGPKDVPFVALRLMKPVGQEIRPRAGASRWIYVNVRQPLPWLVPDTLDVQDRFLAVLSDSRARKIVIRPRVNKGGSPLRQAGDRARNAGLAIDAGTSPWTQLARDAELVILDSFPSTVFMECISAGVPVVAIVPPSTVVTTLAEQFYRRFFAIGLLHRTPESAGEFLNGVSVKTWWTSVQAQAWFPDYVNTFCRT
ncbi:MAG: hypothetical protein AB7J63_05745 [Vicinamibacterales bacterium]